MRILLLVFLVGCTDSYILKTKTVCEKDSVEVANKKADFILKCIENANPKSDEEPEDWIRECETMADNTFIKNCSTKEKFVKSYYKQFGEDRLIPCSEVTHPTLKNLCQLDGWQRADIRGEP